MFGIYLISMLLLDVYAAPVPEGSSADIIRTFGLYRARSIAATFPRIRARVHGLLQRSGLRPI